MSNYPPGMGARDWDHVEGPLTETELDERCPRCNEQMLVRTTWRAATTAVDCDNCDYRREEDEGGEA